MRKQTFEKFYNYFQRLPKEQKMSARFAIKPGNSLLDCPRRKNVCFTNMPSSDPMEAGSLLTSLFY